MMIIIGENEYFFSSQREQLTAVVFELKAAKGHFAPAWALACLFGRRLQVPKREITLNLEFGHT